MATKTLRAARLAAGLSQMALAAAAGVSQTYISDLERGTQSNPTIAVVRRLERALRCALRFPTAARLSPSVRALPIPSTPESHGRAR